ncbi:G-type lectin S-receptor-like serine/threonine-protein kinase [Camellia lanceoleosa]|uniref:G-type lectin S-receptor-like serine/threonine-protein kinase n=1 Tax=Camellia lanceoleosa TaxID=1840588 RepID=A0ACC0H0A0_9ERIC|nr:G-type lectin S-receptor-like serine/threonine-protein kinase [Camellia lanceoleosa]
MDHIHFCSCLEGFEPKDQKERNLGNWTGGCAGKMELTSYAYANLTIETTVHCMNWFGALVFLNHNAFIGKDLYVRLHSSDQVSNAKTGNLTPKRRILIAIAAAAISTGLLFISIIGYVLRRGRLRNPGMFSEGIDPEGRPGIFIWKQHDPYWRSSVYDYSLSYVGYKSPEFASYFTFIAEGDEIYLAFSVSENLINIRAMLTPRGQAELLLWEQSNNSWVVLWQVPLVKRDFYGYCVPFSSCDENGLHKFCRCLEGFEPKDQKEWKLGNWTGCCTRRMARTHDIGDQFSNEAVNCMHRFGDIVDLKGNDINGKDLYVRIHDSDQAAAISTGLLLTCSFGYVLRRRMRSRGRVDRSARA